MKRRSASTLMVALACGGLAGYLALNSVRAGEAAAEAAAPPPQQIVVAARDLPGGAVLGRDDIRLIPWPEGSIPAGFIRSPDEVVGHGLLAPVQSNEPLLTGKVAGAESGGGLPLLIPAGMRAVSVRADDVIAVAGFVVPGTRVDVLATIPAGERQDMTSRVVLQNIQVLASGQSVESGEGDPQSAAVLTLLVTPREAEILTLAASEGRIQLALRNRMDSEVMMTPGAWIRSLAGVGGSPSEERPAARARPAAINAMRSVVEIFNGSARTVVTF